MPRKKASRAVQAKRATTLKRAGRSILLSTPKKRAAVKQKLALAAFRKKNPNASKLSKKAQLAIMKADAVVRRRKPKAKLRG